MDGWDDRFVNRHCINTKHILGIHFFNHTYNNAFYIEKRALFIRNTNANNHHIIHSTKMNGNQPHFSNKKKSRVFLVFWMHSIYHLPYAYLLQLKNAWSKTYLFIEWTMSATHQEKTVSHVFTKECIRIIIKWYE